MTRSPTPRPRGLSLVESLVAVTLLSTLSLSVLSVYAAAARNRGYGDMRAGAALALSQQLGRATVLPSAYLVPEARGAWVAAQGVPEEYGDRTVDFRWEDDPSGLDDLALVRVRVTWQEPVLRAEDGGPPGLRNVPRSLEGAVLVQRP